MKLLLGSLLLAIFIVGCKKDGCIDIVANNYNNEADIDDGTCNYDGSLIFWINANTSMTYEGTFIDEFRVYIDNNYIGSMTTNSSLLSAPQCETGGGISYFEDLKNEKTKVVQYRITYIPLSNPNTTPDEVTEFEGTAKITGGQCTPFQLQ